MKRQMSYAEFNSLCLHLTEIIESTSKAMQKVPRLVAVSRGGISAAHIIAKKMRLPLEYFFPADGRMTFEPKFNDFVIFIEDLIAKGRTYQAVNEKMGNNGNWLFATVLADNNAPMFYNIVYALRSSDWIVFPYEDFDSMKEGDHGLFRDGTDKYAL